MTRTSSSEDVFYSGVPSDGRRHSSTRSGKSKREGQAMPPRQRSTMTRLRTSSSEDVFYSGVPSEGRRHSTTRSGRSKREGQAISPRQRSESSEDSGIFGSSGSDFHQPTGKRSSVRSNSNVSCERRSNRSRRGRVSSGYGSLTETDSAPISPRRSSSQSDRDQMRRSTTSPPPLYRELSAQFVSIPEENPAYSSDSKVQKVKDKWAVGSRRALSTVIDTTEDVTKVKFSGRNDGVNAPDMILNRTRMDRETKQPIQMTVNDQPVDYATISLSTEEEAKYHLREYAKKKFFWRNDVAEKCIVTGTDVHTLFRYRLMTQGESRELRERTSPCRGQEVNGQSPDSVNVWDYKVDAPTSFREKTTYLPLPHVKKVQTCKRCNGNRKSKCSSCNGCGTRLCHRCHGSGEEPMTTRDCFQCSGGHEMCPSCNGNGVSSCENCDARGRVLVSYDLKVTWTVYNSAYMDKMEEVPKKKLNKACGKQVLRQQNYHLDPIREEDLMHAHIRQCSKSYLEQHQYACGHVVRQRQTVSVVPVQKIYCLYKKSDFHFYLVGRNKKIYVPRFPRQRLGAIGRFFSS